MKSGLTDEDIIRTYLISQPNLCFEILYKRYYQTVYQQCLAITYCTDQARDYTQDIFMKVFQKLGAFQDRSRFTTARRPGWLYSIAHNYCRDQMRLGERLLTTAISDYLEMTLFDKTEILVQEEVTRRFTLAMTHLSHREQCLLHDRYEQELSLKEIANLNDLTVSAVKMRLKRVHAKLQRCYAQQRAN